jgi:hypothetical protein
MVMMMRVIDTPYVMICNMVFVSIAMSSERFGKHIDNVARSYS